MPLYDVKCKHCGRVYKDILATQPTVHIVQKCACGSTDFEKLVSAPAVQFKGDGWATKKPVPKD